MIDDLRFGAQAQTLNQTLSAERDFGEQIG